MKCDPNAFYYFHLITNSTRKRQTLLTNYSYVQAWQCPQGITSYHELTTFAYMMTKTRSHIYMIRYSAAM